MEEMRNAATKWNSNKSEIIRTMDLSMQFLEKKKSN